MNFITALIAVSAVFAQTGCSPNNSSRDGKVIDGQYFPGKSELANAARKCGLSDQQFSLSVDEVGVDNVDVKQGNMPAETYRLKMECFMAWAEENNAAAGFQTPDQD